MEMDPISMVIAALISGLVSGVGETSKTFVKDSYNQLKNALLIKLNEDVKSKAALTKLEELPKSKEASKNLDTELRRINIEFDEDILKLALSLLDDNVLRSPAGKYSISIKNSNGVVVGDQTRVEINIQSNKPQKRQIRSKKTKGL